MIETSYGVIPLQKVENDWFVLLIQQRQNYWSFPKGHPEKNETALESATRELKEETGLNLVELISHEPLKERYIFYRHHIPVNKTVFYFLGLVDGLLEIQQEEILAAKWVALKEASSIVTFAEAKTLLSQAIDILSKIE